MIYTKNCKHHKYPVHYMSFSDDVFTKLDMQVQKLIKIIVICYSKPKTWNKWASIFENSTKIKIMMFWFMRQSKMGMETIWMKMLTCRTICRILKIRENSNEYLQWPGVGNILALYLVRRMECKHSISVLKYISKSVVIKQRCIEH